MAEANEPTLGRREFVQAAVYGAALAAAPGLVLAASRKEADKAAVLAQVPKMHAQNVKRLQAWIALPSIAAENRNFTAAPLSLPAGHFGLGHGTGAHAPDEYYLIESTNPKVQGLDGAVASFVEYLYALA
jgi:hypothetical protein